MSPIQAALESIGDGVGCDYRLVPEHDVPVSLLGELGLVKPIFRIAPRCAEHICPLVATCDHRGDFDDRTGVANKKCRLTEVGQRARQNAALITELILHRPLTARIAAAIEPGARSIFTLYWSLVDPTIVEPADRPERPAVRASIDALVAAGRAEWQSGAMVIVPLAEER